MSKINSATKILARGLSALNQELYTAEKQAKRTMDSKNQPLAAEIISLNQERLERIKAIQQAFDLLMDD